MLKSGAILLLGVLAFASTARAAETPAFVNATMCDVAAPISSGATVFSRQIRAERRVAPRPQSRAEAAKPRPPVAAQVEEAPATEAEAVLRSAVHFCIVPGGNQRPVRYT